MIAYNDKLLWYWFFIFFDNIVDYLLVGQQYIHVQKGVFIPAILYSDKSIITTFYRITLISNLLLLQLFEIVEIA